MSWLKKQKSMIDAEQIKESKLQEKLDQAMTEAQRKCEDLVIALVNRCFKDLQGRKTDFGKFGYTAGTNGQNRSAWVRFYGGNRTLGTISFGVCEETRTREEWADRPIRHTVLGEFLFTQAWADPITGKQHQPNEKGYFCAYHHQARQCDVNSNPSETQLAKYLLNFMTP